MSPTRANGTCPATVSPAAAARGFTTCTGPVNPAASRCRSTTRPAEDARWPAPSTTTDDGASSSATERASARCSRVSMTATESCVGAIANSSV